MRMLKENKKLDNKGFSLVELIIVIAIMAVLIGVLAPQYLRYEEKSRESADLDNYETIISAIQIYLADHTISGPESIGYNGGLDSTVTVGTNIQNALEDAGITYTTLKMNSTSYKDATITVSVDTSGVYTITTDNTALNTALGITTTTP